MADQLVPNAGGLPVNSGTSFQSLIAQLANNQLQFTALMQDLTAAVEALTVATQALSPATFPVDLMFSYIGQPGASQRLYRAYVGHPFTLPANLPLSIVACRVAPASNWTANILRGGSSIGTATIAAGATTGTFSFSTAISLVNGNLLEIDAPASPDASIQDPSITLAGTR